MMRDLKTVQTGQYGLKPQPCFTPHEPPQKICFFKLGDTVESLRLWHKTSIRTSGEILLCFPPLIYLV